MRPFRFNLRYVAPELVAADYNADLSTDVFAWAVASHELLANRVIEPVDVGLGNWDMLDAIYQNTAHIFSSLSKLHDTMPIELSRVIDKALATDPTDRYTNAFTLLHDLKTVRQICAGELSDAARNQFVVGDIVELSKFVCPPELLDREAEEAELDSIFSRIKLSGTPEVACCYGRSGSGKSQLIADWATSQGVKNAGQDCFVGWAKLDQHLLRPLSGFISVFCSLLERVFSDPLEDPWTWKKSILNAVAANASLFLSLLPSEWQRVLGTDDSEITLSHESQTVDWDSYISQFRSWATMLLRLFASCHRPLVSCHANLVPAYLLPLTPYTPIQILVIDDYQWMEASERAL
jgi:serine/threonine protein kinase